MVLQRFIDRYKPENAERVSAIESSAYADALPSCLLELWDRHGFGLYGDGLLQIIHPDHYLRNLWGWINQENNHDRLPIALSSFGTIFYYRKLSESDHDIAYINPHTSQSGVLSWDAVSFFNDILPMDEVREQILDINMHETARTTLGPLHADEMYAFAPALRLGGSPSPKHIITCDAKVHLDILLQLALGRER